MPHRFVPEHRLKRGADGREYVRGETEPFTGLVRRHHSNSQSWEERHYRDGPCAGWDAEGRQRVERHFAQGHRHGARREWYANGQLDSEEEWADDRCLQAASFAPDGSPTGTVAAGNGTLKLCWDDGTPRSEESYQDGRLHGAATPVASLSGLFNQSAVLVVLEAGDVVGVITKIDLIEYMAAKLG